MVHIHSHTITTGRTTLSDLQGEKRVEVVPVVFKPAHRKTLSWAADAISSVVNSFIDSPDPPFDVPIVAE